MASTSADPCAICLGEITRGQAVFTAECSHTFHHRCISSPTATATARSERPRGATCRPPTRSRRRRHPAARTPTTRKRWRRAPSRRTPPLPPPAWRPPMSESSRAPLDLVTVLDVSGSMQGGKLALLKQAMRFVIDNLGPADRLSAVSFSHVASRNIRLTRMSDAGKASAKRAVESLDANGSTDIGKGLGVASEVLADRRYRNAVTSVILLSDGQDNCSRVGTNYGNLVPPSFRASGDRPGPMHTFGFGTDHDAAAMHAIAEATGGTFAFVENQEVIQDSFAQCIGGLLSVAVQDARLAVTCPHPGVRVREVKSGSYENRVAEDGVSASVDVGELYAGEERRFLLFVDVPRADAAEEFTQLVKVRCTYRDTATGQVADVAGEDAVVQRPVEVTDPESSKEVERERIRVAAAEDIPAERAAAERGEHAEAGRILQRRRQAVQQSAAGDPAYDALLEELEDLSARAEDQGEYERTGRACLLTGMSTHAQQRGTLLAVRCSGGRTKQTARKSAPQFVTKCAIRMVDRSRKQQQQPPPPPQPSITTRSMKKSREQQEQETSPSLKKRKGASGGSSNTKNTN
ncbi:unnamed protein product [Urochloa decumbens]|uniref:VWFA domain-containing protein n=1 Tax=Urochloa decumbens TaxID=240449 RepID=A0ABC8XGL0_9POAL